MSVDLDPSQTEPKVDVDTVPQPNGGGDGIGLALGGGAALGWAHIGALQILHEEKVPVAAIAGTSIGALVGACFLAGKLSLLEDIARTLSWRRLLRFVDPQVGGPGLIKGDAIVSELTSQIGDLCIEDLSAPFVTVAADIISGQEIWLRTGDVGAAVRASISIPGIFMPVRRGGQVLVDGGLVNPVPVSAVRALGPPLVVAVDVTDDFEGRAQAAGIYRTLAPPVPPEFQDRSLSGRVKSMARTLFDKSQRRPGMFSVGVISAAMIMRELSKSKLALAPPDVHVRPALGHFAPSDFDKADQLISAGRASMLQAIPEIKRMVAKLDAKIGSEVPKV